MTIFSTFKFHFNQFSWTSVVSHRYGENEREGEKLSGKALLVATFKHMRKEYQILIIPLTFWSGVEQGFFGADFTAVSTFVYVIFLHFSAEKLNFLQVLLI